MFIFFWFDDTGLPKGMQCTLPYTHENMFQCIFDGALLNIDEPTMPEMPEIMSSKSSSVPQTTATTPPKGSLTTGRKFISMNILIFKICFHVR